MTSTTGLKPLDYTNVREKFGVASWEGESKKKQKQIPDPQNARVEDDKRGGVAIRPLVEFFAGEVEEGTAEQDEHEDGEEVAGGEMAHESGAEGE